MSSMSPTKIWEEKFKVHSYEIGASGFASPQSICKFLQEAASNHAADLQVAAEDLATQDCMWVLSQLSLQMTEYPKWHDSILLRTWPVQKESALKGFRDFEIMNNNGDLIGRASTMWLMLNSKSKRPLRLPKSLARFVSPGFEDELLSHSPKNSDFPEGCDLEQEFRIRASDIDWNLHVNNVSYLEWALEAIPAEFRLRNFVAELAIAFLAEGKYGSNIVAQCFKTQSDFSSNLHKIIEKSEDKPLALLRTKWTPRG